MQKKQKILNKYLDDKVTITQDLVLNQNEEDEMGRKRGEGKREYNHKLTLYKHALNETNQNKKVEKTIKAAESGHTKAMMALYEFYKKEDKESSYKWLKLAADNKNKMAVEIYKSIKKEEKDFKKKQKEEYKTRTKEIRKLLSENLADLKVILELVLDNDKNAITIIERCYKYTPLTKEEEIIFNSFSSNDYIKYIVALSYKNIDKEKYVSLITKLYDENKMPELANEFNENKNYIFDDVKTRKIVEDIARISNNIYIKKLVVSGSQTNNSESIEFLYMLCENKNRKAVKSVIEYYIENNIDIDDKYIETIMSYDGLVKDNYYEIIINFAIARLYKNNFLQDRTYKSISPSDVVLMFEKASYLENEPIIKKAAIYELIDCYTNGYGVEKNLLKASEYCKEYDPEKAKDLIYKYNYLKGEEKVRNLFNKYKCKQFDDFTIENKQKADKIIKKYINFNEESIISVLKRRDYLLSIGLSIDEIFDDTGYLSEIGISSKVKKIEDEIKRIQKEKLEKERLEKERLAKLKAEKEKTERLKRETEEAAIKVQQIENQATQTINNVPKTVNTSALQMIRGKYEHPSNKDEKALKQYFIRMCNDPLIKEGTIRDYESLVAKRLGIDKDCIIHVWDFESKLQKIFRKAIGLCTPSVSVKFNIEKNIFTSVNSLERNLADLPVYAGKLKIDVTFLQDATYYHGVGAVSEDIWYNEVERFEETNASNYISAGEYAEKSGLNWYAGELRRSEVYEGKKGLKKETRAIINKLFNQYKVVELHKFSVVSGLKKVSAWVPVIVKDIEVTFEFAGNSV